MGTVFFVIELLFDDLQDLHGTSLDTDAAGDALGGGILGLQDHNLHGAGLDALTATDALLLVDHVNASLRVLSNGFMLTDLCALATLDTGHRLCTGALCHDLNAGQILVEFLIKGSGTSVHTLQTCHALCVLFNHEFLHNKGYSFSYVFSKAYYTSSKAK